MFTRLDDFLTYFRNFAVQNNVGGCTTIDTWTYDPRAVSDVHNEFTGPDQRTWIWPYVADRNQWIAVDKGRNIATYSVVRSYNDLLDSPQGAGSSELVVKFFLDTFDEFN